MLEKRVLIAERVRRITGSFAFIEHRFLRGGFWRDLGRHELLLYFFLVMVSDRHGLSYYSYDNICSMLLLQVDEYIQARDSLITKDLIAFDGTFFQVLSLPERPVRSPPELLSSRKEMTQKDPATVAEIIKKSLGRES
jgi:hypothetical protein